MAAAIGRQLEKALRSRIPSCARTREQKTNKPTGGRKKSRNYAAQHHYIRRLAPNGWLLEQSVSARQFSPGSLALPQCLSRAVSPFGAALAAPLLALLQSTMVQDKYCQVPQPLPLPGPRPPPREGPFYSGPVASVAVSAVRNSFALELGPSWCILGKTWKLGPTFGFTCQDVMAPAPNILS